MLFITIISCNKLIEKKNEKVIDKSETQLSKDLIKLHFYNSSSTVGKNLNLDNNITIDEVGYNNDTFESIINAIYSKINSVAQIDKKSIIKIIMYGDKNVLDNQSYNSISIITQNGDGIFFRHYINENQNFNLFNDTIIKFSTYCERDLIALFQSDFNLINYSNPTIEIIKRQSIATYVTNYEKRLSSSLIKMNVKYMAYKFVEGDKYCKKCGGGKSGSCQINEVTQESYCSNPECRVMLIIKDTPIVNLDSIYNFRDNVLQKTNLGQKYTSYYEYISYIINSYDRPETISYIEEVNFLLLTLKAAYTFEYGNNVDIIIDQSYHDKAMLYIQKYKSYIPNPYFQDVLNDITEDLNMYKGKSNSFIHANIE